MVIHRTQDVCFEISCSAKKEVERRRKGMCLPENEIPGHKRDIQH